MNRKTINIFLFVVIGVLLSFIAHGLIEFFYLRHLLSQDIIPEPSSLNPKCYLPSFLQIGLLLLGVFGGCFLGVRQQKRAHLERERETKKKIH